MARVQIFVTIGCRSHRMLPFAGLIPTNADSPRSDECMRNKCGFKVSLPGQDFQALQQRMKPTVGFILF